MDSFLFAALQTGGRPGPWVDIIGIFIFIAGFIVGLGAVTVIDIHGALGRRSAYWTEAFCSYGILLWSGKQMPDYCHGK